MALRAFDRHRERIDQAQGFLGRRGGAAVFLGRWTAFLRAVMPALAGMSKMHYPTFLVWNAAGGIAWGSVVVTAGYLAGRSYARVETWLGRGAAILVAVAVVVALVVLAGAPPPCARLPRVPRTPSWRLGSTPSRMPSAG